MNIVISYHPFRSHRWFVPIAEVISILSFLGVGFRMQDKEFSALLLAMIGFISMCLTKVLYDSSKVVVFFEEAGLRIIGDKYNCHLYLPWGNLLYAYYVRNFKGHLFLTLSPNALNCKEVKSLVNRGANSSRVHIDDVVIICIDVLQDTSQITELVANRVTHIVAY